MTSAPGPGGNAGARAGLPRSLDQAFRFDSGGAGPGAETHPSDQEDAFFVITDAATADDPWKQYNEAPKCFAVAESFPRPTDIEGNLFDE